MEMVKNIRDWLFVDDHCDAIIQVLLNGKTGESYNISAGNEMDNLTIINKNPIHYGQTI